MNQKSVKQAAPVAVAANDAELAPITAMLSSRLIVLANLLKRGAILRYKRLVGLSPVEFGLVASLGRQPPMSVIRLAEAVGMDKGQISRALAELVSRKLVAKQINPRDNRETLVCLTKAGLAAHDTISRARRIATGGCWNNSARRSWRCFSTRSIVSPRPPLRCSRTRRTRPEGAAGTQHFFAFCKHARGRE